MVSTAGKMAAFPRRALDQQLRLLHFPCSLQDVSELATAEPSGDPCQRRDSLAGRMRTRLLAHRADAGERDHGFGVKTEQVRERGHVPRG